MTATILRGEIDLPPDAPPFAGATVRVRLEDVSRQDAAARIVAETTLPGVSYAGAAGGPLRFTLPVPAPSGAAGAVGAPGPELNVRVHVDLNGSGEIDVGDFISTRRHPLPPSPPQVTGPAGTPPFRVTVQRVT